MRKFILAALVLLSCSPLLRALTPESTRLFAQRDTCDLYLDIYQPSEGSVTTLDGKPKPTLLFVFGGGFVTGARNEAWYHPWFQALLDAGYGIVAIDYRLGLKGVKMRFDLFHLIDAAKLTKKAVDKGVEDVFSAVEYLFAHPELGIDPENLVIMGNSAGAMISLSSEWEACNRTALAQNLPEDFHFKGVMSFAGAIMSDSGVPAYKRKPAPQLLVHGTADGAVAYDKTAFGRFGMFGSSSLVEKVYARNGYVYQIFRYKDHSHDMAGNMAYMMDEQLRFLEEEVMQGRGRVIDALLDDAGMHVGQAIGLSDIYK